MLGSMDSPAQPSSAEIASARHERAANVHVVSPDAAFQADEVSVERAVRELLQVVRESLRLEVVFVGRIANGRREFSHVSTSLETSPIEAGSSMALEDTICQRILDGRLPAIVPSVRAIFKEQGLSVEHEALGVHIGVPVHLPNGALYGMLCGFNVHADSQLDERDVMRLKVAARNAARLLSRADGSSPAVDPAHV